jgi:hypothetical protein
MTQSDKNEREKLFSAFFVVRIKKMSTFATRNEAG